MTERAALIGRMRRLVAEIDQMQIDCEYWNRFHPDEGLLEWDPDGQMVALRLSLETALRKEK